MTSVMWVQATFPRQDAHHATPVIHVVLVALVATMLVILIVVGIDPAIDEAPHV